MPIPVRKTLTISPLEDTVLRRALSYYLTDLKRFQDVAERRMSTMTEQGRLTIAGSMAMELALEDSILTRMAERNELPLFTMTSIFDKEDKQS